MKKEKSIFGIYHIVLFISIFLVGCSKESNNYSLGIDGYVYVAEQVELPDRAMEFKIRNGYLYWMEDRGICFDIHRVPVEAAFGEETSTWMLSQGEILLPVGDDVVSSGVYDVDESGNLYYIGRGGFLVKRKPDGMEDYRMQLGDGRESICSLIVGGGDRLFVATNTYIYVVSTGGNLEDTVSIGEYTRRDDLGDDIYLPAGLLKGTGKRIYCAVGWRLWEVAGEGKYQLKLLEDRKEGGGYLASSQGLLYNGEDGVLYQCREDHVKEPILRWSDSMLGTAPDGEILQLSENRLAVYYSGNSMESGFYLLTKTSVEELPKKEIIVFAVCMPARQLEQFVMKFNRSSDRYHVSLEYYQGEEGKDRLDAKIVSGNPPDLIELSDGDVIKYARKNFLEDLAPYLEQSNVLKREDFLDTILEAYTIKGKMVCIPREFLCSTVIGRKSQVGSMPGWTPEDVRNLVGMYHQMELFHNVGLHALVKDFFGPYILEQYIDWDSGECSFDKEGFVSFMEWVAALSEGADTEEWYFETMTGTMDEGRLLSVYAPVDKLYALVRQEIFFQEKVTAMGYPSVDGSPYHYGGTWNRIGILANSNQKEGAWQFLEAFLADTSMEYTFLPNRKSLLQKNAMELTMPDYVLDAEGEKILDKSGHPLVSPRIMLFGIGNGDGRVSVDYMTQEQIDQVYQVIAATDFTPRDNIREEILDIIVEEMSPCLAGRKTFGEAAGVVQNRVQNMVWENLQK